MKLHSTATAPTGFMKPCSEASTVKPYFKAPRGLTKPHSEATRGFLKPHSEIPIAKTLNASQNPVAQFFCEAPRGFTKAPSEATSVCVKHPPCAKPPQYRHFVKDHSYLLENAKMYVCICVGRHICMYKAPDGCFMKPPLYRALRNSQCMCKTPSV